MKYKTALLIILFLFSCSTADEKVIKLEYFDVPEKEKALVQEEYKLLKEKADLSGEEKCRLAFIYKLEGQYLKSYNLFKEVVLKDPENYENMIYINIMDYLSKYCDRADDAALFYKKFSHSITNKYLSDAVKYKLMIKYISRDSDKAREIHHQLGFITNFFMIGPFKNESRAGMDEVYPPEDRIDLNKRYTVSAYHETKWRLNSFHHLDGIDLKSYFTPDQNSIAYFLLYLDVTNKSYHDIIYGSDDGIKIWVNNRMIVNEDIYRSGYFEQNRVKVLFKKGLNKILIKSSQESGAWKLYFRILPLNYSIRNNTNSEGLFLQEISGQTNYKMDYSFSKTEEEIKGNFLKGLYYFITGDYPEKDRLDEKYFQASLKQDNYNPVYNYYYAVAQKEKAESRHYLLRSKAVYSSNVEARSRLGIYYYDLKMFDQAMDYFNQAAGLNNSFGLIKYYKALLFYKNNLPVQALEMFSECEKNNIKLHEVYYYTGQIYWSRKEYKKANDYLLKSFNVDPYNYILTFRNNLISYLVANNRVSMIGRLIKESLKVNPDDPALLNSFSRFYLNRNDITNTVRLNRASLLLDGANPGTLRIASDIMLNQGETNQAVSYLKKIIDVDAHNKNIKRRIAFLQKRSKDPIQDYMPDTDKIVKKIFQKSNKEYLKKYKEASGIVVRDNRIVRVSKNGTQEEAITKIYYILNESGIKIFKKGNVDFNPDFNNVEITSARVIYRDGQEFEASDINTYSLINEKEKLYYSYNRLMVDFPKLKKDTVIVFQYNIWSRPETELGKTYFGDRIIGADFYPVLSRSYTLIMPEEMKLYYHYKNFKARPVVKKEKIETGLVYKWKFENLPRIIYENPMPPIEHSIPGVVLSTFNKWSQVGDWLYKLSEEGMSLNDEMKDFVSDLKSRYKSREKIIEQVYNFVRDRIRYVGIEYGIGGIKPRNTKSIFTSKYGDCKDKAMLMRALLKQAGIKAFMGLVRTQSRGEDDFKLPFLGAFDHAVCVVPLKDKYLFLDATASYFQADEFPYYDRKNRIFLLDPDNYRFVSPPLFGEDENSLVTVLSNTIYEDLSMHGLIRSHRYNQFMPFLRYASTSREEHFKNIESFWNSEFPGSHLLSLDHHIDRNMFEYRIKLNNFMQRSGSVLKFKPILSRIKLYEQFCTAKERKNEILFDYPYTLKTFNIYNLDLNFKDMTLPDEKKIDNSFLFYQVKYKRKNKTVKVERIFKSKKMKILPAEYQKFKKLCIEIERLENQLIEVKR